MQPSELEHDELPRPPPPPPFGPAEVAVQEGTDKLPDLSKDFTKVVVAGKPPPEVFSYKSTPPPLDAHMPAAKLRIFCFDRTSGKPLSGVTIECNTVENVRSGKPSKNYARAFGNSALSRIDGVCVLKLVANTYVLTADRDLYNKFGEQGESLVVSLTVGKTHAVSIGLVPERITVIVTLRELRPLSGRAQKHDATGQVHPLLDGPPPASESSSLVPPQKVAFYSPAGERLRFLAMPMQREGVLGVVQEVQDAIGPALGDFSTDSDGHCFFYGPRLAAEPRAGRGGGRRAPRFMPRPKRDGAPDEEVEPYPTLTNDRWEYSHKYHLRANQESPVRPQFKDYLEQVEYPAHVARFQPPGKALAMAGSPRGSRATSPARRASVSPTRSRSVSPHRQTRTAGGAAGQGSSGAGGRRHTTRSVSPDAHQRGGGGGATPRGAHGAGGDDGDDARHAVPSVGTGGDGVVNSDGVAGTRDSTADGDAAVPGADGSTGDVDSAGTGPDAMDTAGGIEHADDADGGGGGGGAEGDEVGAGAADAATAAAATAEDGTGDDADATDADAPAAVDAAPAPAPAAEPEQQRGSSGGSGGSGAGSVVAGDVPRRPSSNGGSNGSGGADNAEAETEQAAPDAKVSGDGRGGGEAVSLGGEGEAEPEELAPAKGEGGADEAVPVAERSGASGSSRGRASGSGGHARGSGGRASGSGGRASGSRGSDGEGVRGRRGGLARLAAEADAAIAAAGGAAGGTSAAAPDAQKRRRPEGEAQGAQERRKRAETSSASAVTYAQDVQVAQDAHQERRARAETNSAIASTYGGGGAAGRPGESPRAERPPVYIADGSGGGDGALRRVTLDDVPPSLAALNPEALGPGDPARIHNYLLPGQYDVLLRDPGYTLIFYTFAPDNQMAEVTDSPPNTMVPFRVPDPSDPGVIVASVSGGKSRTNSRIPVQLYVRARPWFQIRVIDIESGQEIGADGGFAFSIHRLDMGRSFRSRVERVRGVMMGSGVTNPYDTQAGRDDPEVASFLADQHASQQSGDLWGASTSRSKDGQGGSSSSSAKLPATPRGDGVSDDEVYTHIASGRLSHGMDRRMFITPGEIYAVRVACGSECTEVTLTQARLCTWQLEPFVFYTRKKVIP
ncbi:hypothetical protein FOA52_011752 [Chlamydomonas sp. UWO 241]|nr:hypothetical protein FOA52_011752 [Chlamydomonas sp. UWO 241]